MFGAACTTSLPLGRGPIQDVRRLGNPIAQMGETGSLSLCPVRKRRPLVCVLRGCLRPSSLATESGRKVRSEPGAGAWPLGDALRSELPLQVHRWEKPDFSSLLASPGSSVALSRRLSQLFLLPLFPGGLALFTSLWSVPKARRSGEGEALGPRVGGGAFGSPGHTCPSFLYGDSDGAYPVFLGGKRRARVCTGSVS